MLRFIFFVVLLLPAVVNAERFIIAAASDLRFALDDILALYRQQNPQALPEVIYGSSGKMTTQILHGAPYDLFFSADILYPQQLWQAGMAATEPEVYALGRLVLWSAVHDVSELSLQDLTQPRFRRIAIAQPHHAPYGLRAQEALQAAGVWDQIQPRLVFGENIAHTAQMAQTGAADVAVIALSLARFPTLQTKGYRLIAADQHQPLTQGFVITRRAEEKSAVLDFARFMQTPAVLAIMEQYGFELP